MAARFLSQAWLDEGRILLDASQDFQRRIQGVTATLLTEVEDAPGGEIRTLHVFEEGRLTRMESGPTSAFEEEKPQFRIRGSYDTFARMQRGELSVQAAYLRRKVKLQGDVGEFLRFAPAFIAYNKVMQTVETEY